MSMEEEQARQAAEEQAHQAAASTQPQSELAAIERDEEAMLAQALAMSEGKDVEMGEQDEDMDEEEAIARAIQMSMKQDEKEQGGQQ